MSAIFRPIGHGHDIVPASFVKILVAQVKNEQDWVFASNINFDIYSLVKEKLGPYTSLLQRKAVMCDCLIAIAADESDWGWKEGRDTTAGPQTPDEREAGAFQVSYDSRLLGPDLQAFLLANGIHNAQEFQDKIKASPELDLAYTERLLREPYKRWDGPINRGWIAEQVSPDAVKEFQALLQ